ncbi:MAG: glycosyltransferase [Flavobacteriales bacterium]|nr:glycosyltransferase [Flavobacteriales bacterium]
MVFLYLSIIITAIYFIMVILMLFGFYRIKNSKQSNTKNECSLSVVIAARNEEKNIKNCIDSLLKQNYPKDKFEVLVVDDDSDDETLELILKIKHPNIKVLKLENKQGKKEALKYGIDHTKFNYVVMTDADCVFDVNWLKTIANSISQNTSMLIGPVVFKEKSNFLNSFQQLDMMAMQTITFGMMSFGKPILNNAANLVINKDRYKDVKGHDDYKTPSGDDVFLLEKLTKKSFKIDGFLSRESIVETKAQPNLKEFLNQRLRWASKSKFYQSPYLIFISFLVLLENINLIFIYSHVLLIGTNRTVYIILLLSKWLIDFILLFLISTFYKRRKALIYYIASQLVYPIYVVGVGLASFFIKFEWKGRKY